MKYKKSIKHLIKIINLGAINCPVGRNGLTPMLTVAFDNLQFMDWFCWVEQKRKNVQSFSSIWLQSLQCRCTVANIFYKYNNKCANLCWLKNYRILSCINNDQWQECFVDIMKQENKICKSKQNFLRPIFKATYEAV